MRRERAQADKIAMEMLEKSLVIKQYTEHYLPYRSEQLGYYTDIT